MNADDYAEAALSTWTTEWSIPEQVTAQNAAKLAKRHE